MNLSELKQKSGASRFASIFGKSTIDKNNTLYTDIIYITESLLRHNYGVIHGGYSGGTMQAVSDAAHDYITRHQLSPCLNIGIPQKQHDGIWERVSNASFIDAVDDIYDRLRQITSADIYIVGLIGGDGTELEETIVFHENIIKDNLNKKEGKNISISPLIFCQMKNGTDWKKLITTKLSILSIEKQEISDYPWLYFVESVGELNALLDTMDIKINS